LLFCGLISDISINTSKDGSLYFGPYLYTSLSILQRMYTKKEKEKVIIIIINYKKIIKKI